MGQLCQAGCGRHWDCGGSGLLVADCEKHYHVPIFFFKSLLNLIQHCLFCFMFWCFSL